MFRVLLIYMLLLGYTFASSAKTNVENVCSNCHGYWVHESAFGVSEAPNTLTSADILTKLRAYKNGTLSQYGMGNTMTGQLTNLTDEELVELSEYIPTLKK